MTRAGWITVGVIAVICLAVVYTSDRHAVRQADEAERVIIEERRRFINARETARVLQVRLDECRSLIGLEVTP